MKSDLQKHVVVVLGMHRSGTSAFTRAIQALGVDLGNHLMPPEPNNEKGFFEDLDVNALNVALLETLGHSWHTLAPVSPEECLGATLLQFRKQAADLLRSRLAETDVFGMKDPRIPRLLPFWQEMFAELGIRVTYLIVCRNPMNVARSLKNRDGFDLEKGYILWLEHTLRSLTETVNQSRIVVDYDRLMKAPMRELERIARALGLPFEPENSECASFGDEFLDHTLRHNQHGFEDLKVDKIASADVKKLYEILLRLASDTLSFRSPEVQDAIHWIERRFQEDDALLRYLRVCDDKAEDRARQIARRDVQLAERDVQLAERDAQLAQREAQLARLEAQLAEGRREGLRLQHQLAAVAAEIVLIRQSTSWRVTAPLRAVMTRGRQAFDAARSVQRAVRYRGGWRALFVRVGRIIRRDGLPGLRARLRSQLSSKLSSIPPPVLSDTYAQSPFEIIPCYIGPEYEKAAPALKTGPRVAIHLHLYYWDLLDEFVLRLPSIPFNFDLYVSVPRNGSAGAVRTALQKALEGDRRVFVEEVQNKGRDLAPLIVQFGRRLAEYDIIAHFHSKKSAHCSHLSGWCGHILDLLLGPPGNSGGRAARILELLQTDAKFVYPEGQTQIIKDHTGWGANYALARHLMERHSTLSIDDFPVVEFPEGSMFWARTECMQDFLRLPLDWSDFPNEPIPADGTLAHALERLMLIFTSPYPGRIYRLHRGDSIQDYRYYEEQQNFSDLTNSSDTKVLAYYLPQFHATPENDRWHGEGFTEWTKVRGANPLFEGHYQQHIPHPDIGYYLLDSPETLRQQADLMRKAGVYGQVFYHYWFSGKLILEKPARLLFETSDIEMPFCFCWANENWTRRWDGNEDEILLKQEYSARDARDFIHYLIPYFHDRRYIQIEHRPVLFVYRPASIPDPRLYLDIWKKECTACGIAPPYVVAVLTRGAEDPRDFGMAAAAERVLHDWTAASVPEINDTLRTYQPFRGSVLDYDQVADFYSSQQTAPGDFTWFRSIVPIWDNTARYGQDAFLVHGSTPPKFAQWLERIISYSRTALPADRRFVLVNAWNEWAEGAHLEPDSRYGYAYLNAVGRTLAGIPYGADLNPSESLPPHLRLRLVVPDEVLSALKDDARIEGLFVDCLSRSTIFDRCEVEIEPSGFVESLPEVVRARILPGGDRAPEWILQVRRVVFFAPDLMEKMLRSAWRVRGSVVLSNAYDRHFAPIEATANGSVDSARAFGAPLLLMPAEPGEQGYRNYRVRSDAHSFVAYPNTVASKKLPYVSTIIRYHGRGDLRMLRNALYCLAAMQDCIVMPLIAVQDLDDETTSALRRLLDQLPWPEGRAARVLHFRSPDGKGDLRAKMLNEALKKSATRYAGFLDYDDLLMSHAYVWLLDRLRRSGKAVSFGRVYSTIFDCKTGLFLGRKREFTHGVCYEDFLECNHAPLHSFLLDLDQLDLNRIRYHEDQRYLEDYFLTLQLFTRGNADWDSLTEGMYIGDYIHVVGGANTLAVAGEEARQSIVTSREYTDCEQRIQELRRSIHGV